MMTDAQPASDKQLNFIAKLCQERGIPAPHVTGKFSASKIIDKLLATPKPATPAQVTAISSANKQVEPGYYTIDDAVYRVMMNKAGTHRYAKLLTPSYSENDWTWEYAPGAMKAIAEKAVPLTLQKAQQLGHLWTRCVICGHKLTVPESIAAGIGPVCAKKL